MLRDKKFLRFLIIFALVFLLCYFGAIGLSGLAVPGGSYSAFAEKYFDIAGWMRNALMFSVKMLLKIFGVDTYRQDEYILRSVQGGGIRLVYSCLGFGIMSFWIAYIIATAARLKNKLIWLTGGLLMIFLINTIRISLVLQVATKGGDFPFGLDHHTWFNIVAYLFIFLLMYFQYRQTEKTNDAGTN